MTIPASLRKQYGLSEGDAVSITLVDDEIRIHSWRKNLERVRQLVNQRIPSNVSLVDELIAERRAEAAREEAEYQAYKQGLVSE